MFQHSWFFRGIVKEIIDGRTLTIWADLGFDTWKIIPVRFNRLRVNQPLNMDSEIVKYLQAELKRKKIYLQTTKSKGGNFFAEIYTNDSPIETGMSLRDLNKTLAGKITPSDSGKIEGLTNINDLLVKKGLAEYAFTNLPVHNRSPRERGEIQQGPDFCYRAEYKTDSSGSGSIT